MTSINRSKQTPQVEQEKDRSRRILYETVIILALTFVAQFLWKDYWLFIAFLPTAYFFIERYLRRRTWVEIGFNLRAIPDDLKANWFMILLVSVVIQFLVVWGAKAWWPAFLDHVIARVPLTIGQTVSFLPLLLIGALWEEINYRAFFQERLSWFIRAPLAIGFVSVIFGLGHWAGGNPMIVIVDILLVILDSIFYGIIFERSKNVFVSWIAHFLANLFAIGFLLSI